MARRHGHVGGDPRVALAEFERTGRISWTSDLADIPAQARAAEEGGASTLWLACHLYLRDPITTAALALCVFVAVPAFGIAGQGVRGYLKSYLEPTIVMLPFNIISELSRTLALAVRLFGNMMSGAMIVAILLTITPFLFPVVMTLLGLLTGMVQAYIFSILAAVYIAAATRTGKARPAPAVPKA